MLYCQFNWATYIFCIQIGQACLKRSYYLSRKELEEVTKDKLLLHSQLPVLEAFMHCVQRSWMAILVSYK